MIHFSHEHRQDHSLREHRLIRFAGAPGGTPEQIPMGREQPKNIDEAELRDLFQKALNGTQIRLEEFDNLMQKINELRIQNNKDPLDPRLSKERLKVAIFELGNKLGFVNVDVRTLVFEREVKSFEESFEDALKEVERDHPIDLDYTNARLVMVHGTLMVQGKGLRKAVSFDDALQHLKDPASPPENVLHLRRAAGRYLDSIGGTCRALKLAAKKCPDRPQYVRTIEKFLGQREYLEELFKEKLELDLESRARIKYVQFRRLYDQEGGPQDAQRQEQRKNMIEALEDQGIRVTIDPKTGKETGVPNYSSDDPWGTRPVDHMRKTPAQIEMSKREQEEKPKKKFFASVNGGKAVEISPDSFYVPPQRGDPAKNSPRVVEGYREYVQKTGGVEPPVARLNRIRSDYLSRHFHPENTEVNGLKDLHDTVRKGWSKGNAEWRSTYLGDLEKAHAKMEAKEKELRERDAKGLQPREISVEGVQRAGEELKRMKAGVEKYLSLHPTDNEAQTNLEVVLDLQNRWDTAKPKERDRLLDEISRTRVVLQEKKWIDFSDAQKGISGAFSREPEITTADLSKKNAGELAKMFTEVPIDYPADRSKYTDGMWKKIVKVQEFHTMLIDKTNPKRFERLNARDRMFTLRALSRKREDLQKELHLFERHTEEAVNAFKDQHFDETGTLRLRIPSDVKVVLDKFAFEPAKTLTTRTGDYVISGSWEPVKGDFVLKLEKATIARPLEFRINGRPVIINITQEDVDRAGRHSSP